MMRFSLTLLCILLSLSVSALNDDGASTALETMILLRGNPSKAFRRDLIVDEPKEEIIEVEKFPIDISSYSIRFEKCQAIKTPHDSATTIGSALKRYAVFRLCPQHECASCEANYGEYVLELGEYLTVLSAYFHEAKGALCEICQQCETTTTTTTTTTKRNRMKTNAKLEDFGSSCQTCQTECQMMNDMAKNAYIDATQFLQCTKIHSDLNGGQSYFAGPVCSQDGLGVKIGLFTDDYCQIQDTHRDIREFLVTEQGLKANLAYSYLRLTYSETCLSCKEDQVEGQKDLTADEKDLDTVKNFCEVLYDHSSKCESVHGFAQAVVAAPPNRHRSPEQDEKKTCDFIHSLVSKRHHRPAVAGNDQDDITNVQVEEANEKRILDHDAFVVVIVGVSLALVVMGIKLCGYPEAGYSPIAKGTEDEEGQTLGEKVSTQDHDVTESSSRSSSMEDVLTQY